MKALCDVKVSAASAVALPDATSIGDGVVPWQTAGDWNLLIPEEYPALPPTDSLWFVPLSAPPLPAKEDPVELIFSGDISDGWAVNQPIPVSAERDSEGGWIVSDGIFAVYGVGEDLWHASMDYLQSLVEYYQIMADAPDSESQAVVDHLRTYLRGPAK